jgi:hypothetical protein
MIHRSNNQCKIVIVYSDSSINYRKMSVRPWKAFTAIPNIFYKACGLPKRGAPESYFI